MAKILVMAGHEGLRRNYGSGSTSSVGTSGTPAVGDEEYKLTPIVADQVTKRLRDAGHNVIREDAFFDEKYSVDLALSIHFDGSGTPCASGHSFGYPAGVPAGSNKPSVDIMRDAYVPWLPDFVNVMRDNFTGALKGNYAYGWTNTSIAEFLIELCELSCPEQSKWALERIGDGWFGKVIAHGLDKAAGGNTVPHPGDWRVAPAPELDLEPVLARLTALEKADRIQQVATSQIPDMKKGIDLALAQSARAHTRLNRLRDV